MGWTQVVGLIGLVVNAVGVVIVFFFAWPGAALPPDDMLTDGTGPTQEERQADHARRKRLSRWGAVVMLAGMVLQAVAVVGA